MVKVVAFFRRRPGMAVEDFQTYWRTRHPEVVTKLAGVRRYVQSHTRQAAYRQGEPVYDGIAELWFDDTAAMHALRDTPEMAAVQADEARFIDRSTMGLIITEEHVIKDGAASPGMAKSVGFIRRKPGTASRGVPAALAGGARAARRRDSHHATLRAKPHAAGRLRPGAGAGLGRHRDHLVR